MILCISAESSTDNTPDFTHALSLLSAHTPFRPRRLNRARGCSKSFLSDRQTTVRQGQGRKSKRQNTLSRFIKIDHDVNGQKSRQRTGYVVPFFQQINGVKIQHTFTRTSPSYAAPYHA